MPQASALRSPTIVREYAAPRFVCSWDVGSSGAAWVQVGGELDHVILDADRDVRREGGRLLIVRGPAQVDRVLTLTEVGKRVVIFDLAPADFVPAPADVLPPGVAV